MAYGTTSKQNDTRKYIVFRIKSGHTNGKYSKRNTFCEFFLIDYKHFTSQTMTTSTSTSAVNSIINSTVSSRSSESHSDKGTKKKLNDHRFSSWNLFRRSQSLGKLFWIISIIRKKCIKQMYASSHLRLIRLTWPFNGLSRETML